MSPTARVLLAAVLVLPLSRVHAQVSPAQRHEIENFVRAYADAANRGDITAYMEMYSRRRDLIEVNDGEFTRGWDALRDESNRMIGLEGSYKISVGSIDVVGLGATRAIAVFPFVATIATQQGVVQLRGASTLVLDKGPQGWKIIHDHTSSVSPTTQ